MIRRIPEPFLSAKSSNIRQRTPSSCRPSRFDPVNKGDPAMTRLTSQRHWIAAAASLGVYCAFAVALGDFSGDDELDGMWKLVSVELGGETRELEDEVRWVIKDGKVLFGGEALSTVVIYDASAPRGIDLGFFEPKDDYEGIYALDKDELKICLNTRTTGPKDRPFDFDTKAKLNLRVLTFKRI